MNEQGKRLEALHGKLASIHARHLAMTTGPDKGPMDWYQVNGQIIIVHLYANQRGYEVYAPIAGANLSVSDTFDALDRIAASNPAPLSVDRQLTGALAFLHIAAMGNTEASDLQRLACALLGQITPNPAKPQPLTIEEMHSIAPTGGTIAAMQPTAADKGTAKGVIDDPLWTAYDMEAANQDQPHLADCDCCVCSGLRSSVFLSIG